MKKYIILLLSICFVPTYAFADTFLGVYLGAGVWNQKHEGKVQFLGSDVDLQNEFGLSSSTNEIFYIAFEHAVPVLPNIKLQYSSVSTTGSKQLSKSVTFDNTTYNVGDTINSRYALDNTDFILYYEVLDNWLSLDLGVDIKVFDGEVAMSSTNTSNSSVHAFDEPLPMLYAKAQFDIPITGFYISGEGSAIKTDDSKVADFKLLVGYESDLGLGGELGWRKLSLDVDDADDMFADVSTDGFFANITYHF